MALKRAVPALCAALTIAALAPASAPAFVGVENKTFTNWAVAGSLEPKKLGEPIALPPGSVFNGAAGFSFENFFENVNGTIGGTVTVPPFNASLRLLGVVPTTVGVTFEQVGAANGTITAAPITDCPNAKGGTSFGTIPCVNVSVPTKVNIGLTFVEPLGLKLPTHCHTDRPIDFNLSEYQELLELAVYGPAFSGTVTIPPIACEGPEALTLAPALTLVMSGPNNPYSIEINNPEGLKRP